MAGSGNAGRVLVVEDNPDGLRMLVELIEASGHAVRGAADGAQALRIVAAWRPDLVLLDPARYVDTATYVDPCRVPDGVVGVWVDGVRAWKGGAPTGARRGGVVR